MDTDEMMALALETLRESMQRMVRKRDEARAEAHRLEIEAKTWRRVAERLQRDLTGAQDEARAEVERLREALGPLAAIADVVEAPAGCPPEEFRLFVRIVAHGPTHRITLADAIRARAALRGEGE